jgi:hypothetical protein
MGRSTIGFTVGIGFTIADGVHWSKVRPQSLEAWTRSGDLHRKREEISRRSGWKRALILR